MEKRIENKCFVVGWTTRGHRGLAGNLFRYSRRIADYEEAFKKYSIISNKDRTVYCYLDERVEYSDGSVRRINVYHI